MGNTTAAGDGIKIVDSDVFPADQTGPAGKTDLFTVVANSANADELRIKFDGETLPSRYFSASGKTASTSFELTPDAGQHALELITVAKDGSVSVPEVYRFGARTITKPRVGKGAAAGDPVRVGGRFVEPDGSPAVGLPVEVYAPHVFDENGNTPTLARATTKEDGSWETTLPELSDQHLKSAGANGGVLALDARAEGVAVDPQTGSQREMMAVSSFDTGVVVDGTLSEAAIAALEGPVVTAPLLPVLEDGQMPEPPPVRDEPVDESYAQTPEEKQYAKGSYFDFKPAYGAKSTSANPRVVGGIDFTNVAVTAGSATPTTRQPAAPGDQCYIEGALVTQRPRATAGYTTALESHAAQDATGAVNYESKAQTQVSAAISYNNGKTWGASGSYAVSNSIGWSSGFSHGPNYSREWKIPIVYGWYNVYKCTMISGVKKLVYKYSRILRESAGPVNGGATGAYGRNVLSDDSWYNYRDAPHKSYVPYGSHFEVKRENAVTYTAAVSVFGFTVTATTTKSDARSQKITAGRQAVRHNIFAWQPLRENAKVFYSY